MIPASWLPLVMGAHFTQPRDHSFADPYAMPAPMITNVCNSKVFTVFGLARQLQACSNIYNCLTTYTHQTKDKTHLNCSVTSKSPQGQGTFDREGIV